MSDTVRRVLPFLCVIVFGCDEDLPPRNDPRDILRGRIDATYGLSAVENKVYVRLSLTNIYDEVLEGGATVSGSISVELPRIENSQRTFLLSPSHFSYTPSYQSGSGILQVPPGDSVVFQVEYDFMDDTGRSLLQEFTMRPDPTCGFRMIADRESFRLQGRAMIFSRVAQAEAQGSFEICWASEWVNPKFCPPVTSPTSACVGG